ncbi:MAG TPA: general secretion pathway protein GspB [Lysobacter sp.]
MSLILEALRKSEAERRRGQVPTLHAERAPAALHARTARPAWPWLALATVAVVAMAWLARGAWPPPRAVETSADTVGRSTATAAVVETNAREAGAHERDAAVTTPVADAPPALLDPPNHAGMPPSLRPTGMETTAAREHAAVPPPRADAAAATSPRDAMAMADRVATPMPPAGVALLPRPLPPSPPAIATAIRTAPVPAPTAAIAAAPLRLADLSAAERLELPPLKMSMHMWDPAPAQRFAIIDGARVSEGDRLGDAVVDEITASAVVLAWRGQRLQIPLR